MNVMYGTVSATSPLEVRLPDGISVRVPRKLTSYTPADGDEVVAIKVGIVWCAIGAHEAA